MSRLTDRLFEVAEAALPSAPRDGLAHPFGLDEHEPHRWRLSRDVWEALCADAGCSAPEQPGAGVRILGETVTVDDNLPPNSALLEPILATMVANAAAPSVG